MSTRVNHIGVTNNFPSACMHEGYSGVGIYKAGISFVSLSYKKPCHMARIS